MSASSANTAINKKLNVDEILNKRLLPSNSQLVEGRSLETRILDRGRLTPQQHINSMKRFDRVSYLKFLKNFFKKFSRNNRGSTMLSNATVQRAVPLAASVLVIVFGLINYAGLGKHDLSIAQIDAQAKFTDIDELELKEIWLLQDEIHLL